MGSYKSRYTGEQIDIFLSEVPKLSRKIEQVMEESTTMSYYEVSGVTPSPLEWFTFVLRLDGKGYSVKANFNNEDADKTEIVIPYEYKGLPVVSIFESGFADKVNITKIIMPNSISSVSAKVFQNCTSLKEVVISKNIKVLTSSLFQGCTGLTHIDLPKGIKEIQHDAFRETGVQYMAFPYGIEYVAETLFYGCRALKFVRIPNSVTEIKPQAFAKCSSLETIKIPNSVTSLGIGAFSYCENLKSVVVPPSVTRIESDAFWDKSNKPNPNVTLYVEQGSYTEEYAKQYNMKYVYGDIAEFPKQTNPDYNQNDASQTDYIKNRPFYDSNIFLLSGNLLDYEELEGSGVSIIPMPDLSPFSAGQEVIIELTRNGKTLKSSGITVTEDRKLYIPDMDGYGDYYFESEGDGIWLVAGVEGEALTFPYNNGGNYDFKIHVELLKQIEEKFIPDSIPRVKKERKYYADVELSNSEFDNERGAYFIPIEGLASIDVTPFELIVEVDDNGTSHKATAYFDGCSLMDKFANPITLDGYEFWDYTDNKLYFNPSQTESFDGVTLRIYKETTKKIEKEYLPKCDVPYIYSDVEEDVIFGRVALVDLDSGAYVLHGVFDTAPGYMNFLYHFATKPTLCHIANDHQGTLKLYWLDEDTDTEDGVCVRSMLIVDFDIVSDITIPLSGADAAYELASQANETAEAALVNAMDAVDGLQAMQEGVDIAIASAEEAHGMASVALDNIGDIDAALDAILELDKELLIPNGDEVKY